MVAYEINPEWAYELIKSHWTKWANSVGAKGWVVGISGGKDSTVVAALAARIFGKENVLGVMMPNGRQADIKDSIEVCSHLGIPNVGVNISFAFNDLINQVAYGIPDRHVSEDTRTNMPARLRMTALYAIAQSLDRRFVLNTSNLSENVVGFSTLYGDHAGSYAPIQELTVTEVIALGDWLGIPQHLTHKAPIDGLQPKSDEEKLGFKYADLDKYIRQNEGSEEFKAKIDVLYRRNKFKTDMLRLPGPMMGWLKNWVEENNLENF